MKDKKKYSLKERFQYWFDGHLSKSSLGLIRVLIIASVILAVSVALLIILFNLKDGRENGQVFWESIVTLLNAWMPEWDEDGNVGYILLMSVSAIAGVLFTSVLIGIITSAIEEKIIELKQGNSRVLEEGHTVVLGFCPGEFTLLRELILAAGSRPACIVVAEDMARDEMEQEIGSGIEVPKNVRLICRSADITDPASLEKCSIETSRAVIISPADDARTVKAILALTSLLTEKGAGNVPVNAIISRKEHRIPQTLASKHHITALETNETLAKMIAHSCAETGLSETFREVFNFEGAELHVVDPAGAEGLTFGDLTARMDGGVPVGIFTECGTVTNPPAGRLTEAGDRILVFAEDKESAKITEGPSYADVNKSSAAAAEAHGEEKTDVVIIGHNGTLATVIRELPENVEKAYLTADDKTEEERAELGRAAQSRALVLSYVEGDPRSEEHLLELARMADHIVIMSDDDKEDEEADMDTIFLILNLRDLRERYGLTFNITAEMCKEYNEKLVSGADHTDFVVASNMSSLCLAQVSERPELVGVFRELLSNTGNELYLKNAAGMGLAGTYIVRDLRCALLAQGYVLLGIVDAEKKSTFDLPLMKTVELTEDDEFIVLGEE
ncbi:MAG: hypothetical protein IIY46_04865 [Lachnospiraceae bacterium]|nr:hypothetical protein [Lachnospiraceae bacterium]